MTGLEAKLRAAGIDDVGYAGAIAEVAQKIQEGHFRRVAVAGAQGSGKSTFARLLAGYLIEAHGVSAATLSLDDFYLTRRQRATLAQRVHKNFAIRGVPGTHDMALLAEAQGALLKGQPFAVPVFSKSEDDRQGTRLESPAQVLIHEGWCWGARPQPADLLQVPVNELERESDADGRWRQAVNDHLASDAYQDVFSTELLVFLQVPDFDAVLRWRWQQEQGLPAGSQSMSFAEVRRFISYYERVTRWMLTSVPGTADVLLPLDVDHRLIR